MSASFSRSPRAQLSLNRTQEVGCAGLIHRQVAFVAHPNELITRVPLTRSRGPFGDGVDQVIRRWFNRNVGLWRSHRRFDFCDGSTVAMDTMLHIESFEDPLKGDSCYRFRWWPAQKDTPFSKNSSYLTTGAIEAYLIGHQLYRSRGYFCGSPIRSRIRQVDEQEVVFESHYMEWDVLEHIRLVDDARYRARSIYSWQNSTLALVEVHHEVREDLSAEEAAQAIAS